jgi:hypothetical protein
MKKALIIVALLTLTTLAFGATRERVKRQERCTVIEFWQHGIPIRKFENATFRHYIEIVSSGPYEYSTTYYEVVANDAVIFRVQESETLVVVAY